MITLLNVAGGACIFYPFIRSVAALILRWPQRNDCWLTATGDLLLAVANALQGDWPWAAGFFVLAVCNAIWWWRGRKQRRTLATLGNKARARIAAMKQAMRERAQPRPVLRPGLQGAR